MFSKLNLKSILALASLSATLGFSNQAFAQLTIVSFGGAYQEAQSKALFQPAAKALGIEIGGTGRAGFSAECNYVSFLAGLVSSMDAVVAQCRSGPRPRGKNLTEVQVGKEIGKLARDFAATGEFGDMKEAKARFLILALDNFPS